MDKKKLELYQHLHSEFCSECERVKKILEDALNMHGDCSDISFASTFNLAGDSVFWEGDEYWQYQGHEHHYGCFPAVYLTMTDDELRKEVEYINEEYRKEEEAKKKKSEEAEKAKRLAQYEALKKEFEG